jgi:hypothetical protein
LVVTPDHVVTGAGHNHGDGWLSHGLSNHLNGNGCFDVGMAFITHNFKVFKRIVKE